MKFPSYSEQCYYELLLKPVVHMGSTEKSRCTSIIKDVNKPNLIAQHLFITKKRNTMNINHYLKPSDVDGT